MVGTISALLPTWAPLDRVGCVADGKKPDGSTITGPAYEYIVVGNSRTSVALSYPAATRGQVHSDADPSRSSGRRAGGRSRVWLELQRRRYRDQPGRRNFVANDIYEFAYTAKDPTVAGLGFAAVRDWMEFLRYETHDDKGNGNPLANYIKRIYTEISSQPGPPAERFPAPRLQRRPSAARKAFDGHMQWIAAGNGINMNYRFSQSGRTERNRQNHLYIEGRFPFANVRTTDPFTRTIDSRIRGCEKTEHLPARRGDLLGERVLGEVGVAPAHDAGRHTRPAGFAVHAQLPHVEHAARHRQAPAVPARSRGALPASPTIR